MDARDARIAELEATVAAQAAVIAELRALVESLRREVAELKRAGKRTASPYSKGTRKTDPKKPGRKPGEGGFERRGAPAEADVTHTERAPVEEEFCACGGAWDRTTEEASVTDIPEKPAPVVTRLLVDVCRCTRCGKKVRGRHPLLAPDQHGATAHRIGERAKAAAHVLHYGVGIPVRRVPRVLEELTGLTLTQSAVTQDAMKRAHGPLAPAYDELRSDIPRSPTINTDDTGWRVKGEPAQLMNFNTPDTSVFQTRRQHRNEEVRELVPADYSGVLGTDRGPAYDAIELSDIRQQKCNFHILRNVATEMETQDADNRWFGRDLKDIIQEALALHRRFRAGDVGHRKFRAVGLSLNRALTSLLRPRPRALADPGNQRLLEQLGWHHGRGNILRYLDEPIVDPTNNVSERELRGGVVARKVSHCSKNWRGAGARDVFVSIIRTNLRRLRDVPMIEALLWVFHTGRPPPRLIHA